MRQQLRDWMFSRPPSRFCAYFNMVNTIYWRSPIVLEWDSVLEKIIVAEGDDRLYIARPARARRYRQGITAKLDALADEYLLGHINFRNGDCVIDCGANVGEVGLWIQKKYKGVDVLSIEPEQLEAECCDLNLYGGEAKTIRKALWREECALTFYSKNDSGDSSLFETVHFESARSVSATTLSKILAERDIRFVKLLKLESEGAEPEILAGAEECLERIEYISADLGPERGIAQETTAAPAINFLLQRDFRLVDVFPDRLVCLFRNERFNPQSTDGA